MTASSDLVAGWGAEESCIYLRSNDRPPEQIVLECIAETIEAQADTILALEADKAALVEAVEPSAETKAAYIGEFSFCIEQEDETGAHYEQRVDVPWYTVKQIMAAIKARATLAKHGGDK